MFKAACNRALAVLSLSFLMAGPVRAAQDEVMRFRCTSRDLGTAEFTVVVPNEAKHANIPIPELEFKVERRDLNGRLIESRHQVASTLTPPTPYGVLSARIFDRLKDVNGRFTKLYHIEFRVPPTAYKNWAQSRSCYEKSEASGAFLPLDLETGRIVVDPEWGFHDSITYHPSELNPNAVLRFVNDGLYTLPHPFVGSQDCNKVEDGSFETRALPTCERLTN